MIYRTDYHIHTLYSDGKAQPEDYIDAAIEAGLNEIGFAEHLNLRHSDLHWCMDIEKVPVYLEHISRLRDLSSGIKIKTGLEVDYFPGMEKESELFLEPLKLDYVIGSVHYMGENSVDNSIDFFTDKNVDRLFEEYFEIVYKAVSSNLFDIIAHCDLVRIFGHRYSGDTGHFYSRLASLMAKYDIAFEVNTNGKNRPLGEFYPDIRFLYLFRKANVPVCVNSDAHMPARVGENFDEAYKLLKDAGYVEMCTFTGRRRKMVPFVL